MRLCTLVPICGSQKIVSGFLLFHFRQIPLRPSLLLHLKLTFCQLGWKLASLNNYSVMIIQSWLVIQLVGAQHLACLLGVREPHDRAEVLSNTEISHNPQHYCS